jgi:hypothetical protein
MLISVFLLTGCDALLGAINPNASETKPSLLSDALLQDDSFISDELCAPPCWRGIIPGETTWLDAMDILRNDPNLTNLQFRADEATLQVGAAWAQRDGDNCCQMFSEDGEIVSFIVAQTVPDVLFSEVIQKHGEPSYIIGDIVDDEQALASVYYPDVPMLIYLFAKGQNGELNGSSPVVGFAYLTDALMRELLMTSNLHAWDGYKTFAEYMSSPFELTPVPQK